MPDRGWISMLFMTHLIFRYHLPLKGLTNEMDFAFDDMYDYF
jgi:hypothetical protein